MLCSSRYKLSSRATIFTPRYLRLQLFHFATKRFEIICLSSNDMPRSTQTVFCSFILQPEAREKAMMIFFSTRKENSSWAFKKKGHHPHRGRFLFKWSNLNPSNPEHWVTAKWRVSITKLNNYGDRRHPCLTPLWILMLLVCDPAYWILDLCWEYISFIR